MIRKSGPPAGGKLWVTIIAPMMWLSAGIAYGAETPPPTHQWVQVQYTQIPDPPTGSHCPGEEWRAYDLELVHMSGSDQLLAFGGSGITYYNMLEFVDGRWECYFPTTAMPSRYGAASAYDSDRNVVVVVGGDNIDSDGQLGDTWEFDGNNWVEIVTPELPQIRWASAAYDSLRKKVVLFGGTQFRGPYNFNTTWEYDGVSWTAVETTTQMQPTRHTAMTFDETRGRMVLFGGLQQPETGVVWPETISNETWEYDGIDWTLIDPPTRPAGRYGSHLLYNPERGRSVLAGGFGSGLSGLDMWEFDGTQWTPITTALEPPPRSGPAFTHDRLRNVTIMFGGTTSASVGDEMWELRALPQDADGDGRPDTCESDDDAVLAEAGSQVTHLQLPDSDGDGLLDGQESAGACTQQAGTLANTNPRIADTDGDGFSNGLEVLVLLSDPLDPDSPDTSDHQWLDGDGDGVPASLDPDDNNIDGDGDRYSDAYELQQGTDPLSATSKPLIGDANGNGAITAVDVTLLKQVLQGLSPSAAVVGNMDTTQNGRLGATDVTRLKQYLVDPSRPIP